MTTEQKPTKEKVNRLINQLHKIGKIIEVMIVYHSKRVDFFKNWNLWLKIFDAFVGVGGLVAIGLSPDRAVSFVAAGIAVFLLFITVIFDFSKKEETHLSLSTIYRSYNKEISDINLITWDNLTHGEYKKYRNLYDRLNEGINNSKGKEYPALSFLHFLSEVERRQSAGEPVSIISHVKRWQFLLADYFSMSNTAMILFEKFNAEQRQKQQRQQPNKDK